MTSLGRNLAVPEPVVVEVDELLRSRESGAVARLFLQSLSAGEHTVVFPTAGVLRRAVEIDEAYRDLDLGYVDAAVMAIAERYELPILTFDFGDFRATQPRSGYWRLVIDEARYADETG